MALAFRVENPIPSFGDDECDWLESYFPSEFEELSSSGSVTVSCVRITKDRLRQVRKLIVRPNSLDTRMLTWCWNELARREYLDVLLWY